MAIDPKQVQAAFLEAVAANPAERGGILDRVCAGDAELRRRVEQLVRAHDDSGGLPSAAGAGGGTVAYVPRAELEPGAMFAGRYKLREKLGEGGMGVVWVADQTAPVQRRIALKVIKSADDSRRLLARFEQERQALALMDHPHIAKVLDAGVSDDGRPYFVMELIKGVPLTKYCDEARLTPRERLELFVPVCQAVQHAHQKGIIHRDLKPSNILVGLYDGRPVPKVIDFGVAKATGPQISEQSIYTEVGAMIGTLEYMSPEQAEPNNLDIDTRSDIYALGVILYELLTGGVPFSRKEMKAAGLAEMLRIIKEVEPAKPSMRLSGSGTLPRVAACRHTEPSKLTRLVHGELDWIVMKCLEKERSRRYETANGLARDIGRYLADEVVEARPPSAWYQLRKFTRRHKAGLWTTAAAALVLLVAAGGVGWVLWDQAARRVELAGRMAETDKTVTAALAKADQSAERAGRQRSTTSAEALAALAEWREAAASLAEGEAALTTGAATGALRERVADTHQRIEAGRAEEQRKEKLFRELDEARMAQAALVENTFNYAGAAAQYGAAFVGYGLQIKPWDTAQLARQIRAEDPAVRAALLVALENWAYAASLARTTPSEAELGALAAAADDDPWRQRFREAVAMHDGAKLRDLSVEARRMSLPSSSLVMLADLLAAADKAEAVALLRWARVEHPTDFWIHFDLGTFLNEGRERTPPLELEEAIGCLRTAVALRPDSGPAHNNLGVALKDKNQLDDAIAECNKAIALDPKFAAAHINLGNALQRKNQLDDAIAEYRKAIALDPKDAKAHSNLGAALQRKNQLDDAIAECNKAIALDPKFALAHNNLGLALAAKNQLDDAIAEYRKAIALDPKAAIPHYNLGVALRAKNQLDDAIAEYRKAIALDPKFAAAHNSLGTALRAKNQLDDAIAEHRKAIDIDPKDASAHHNLGFALAAKNQLDDAIAEYRKAIELDPKTAQYHYNLGLALGNKQQLDEAIQENRRAIELRPDYAEAHCNLGHALGGQGQFAAALEELRKGHELGSKQPGWHYPSAQWVKDAERLIERDRNLGAILEGKQKPADDAERLGLAQLCQHPFKKLYAASSRFFAEAFASDGKLADDMQSWNRYNAACAAALAGCGQGNDADKLDDKERARLRKQAVEWLRADLAYWTKQAESEKPADREMVLKTLKHWQDDADLAGIRDKDAVAKLAAEEQKDCRKLWMDVIALLEKAGATK